jgi:hypothetical protein
VAETDKENQVVIDYTRRDFETIREWLLGTAQGKLPEWQTVGQAGDFGTLLLEMYAYMGDVTNYYVDRVGAEAFLGTAQRRQSVYYMADMLGYHPVSQRAASVELVFSLSASSPSSVTINAGTTVVNNVDDQADGIFFETDTKLVLDPGETKTVLATEGLTIPYEGFGNSTGKPNASWSLSNKGVIFQSVRFYTNEGGVIVPWTEVDSVSNARPNQSAFSTYLDDADVTHIMLGDSAAGRVPPSGSEIYASYRYGRGSLANSLAAGTLTVLVSNADWSSYVTVTNPNPPLGGADAETIDSMRFSIPRANRVRSRAVTLDDHITLALQVPGVAKAIAYGSVYSSVTVRVAPVGGFDASEDFGGGEDSNMSRLRASVVNYLSDKVLIGAQTFVERPQWHDVEVAVELVVLDGYVRETVRSQVQSAISDLFAFERLDFGQKVTKGDIYRAATKIPGVDYVELTRLRPTNPGPKENPRADVQNILTPPRKIAQLQRSRLSEDFGTVTAAGLTVTATGGLEL